MALFIAPGVARAEDPSITATLSSNTASIGETVELQIVVSGAEQTAAPPIQVAGLNIQYVGASTSVQIINFNVSRSVTHTYTVLPQRPGTFTIPALVLDVAGKKVSTRPLTLTVTGQAAPQGQPQPAPGQQQQSAQAAPAQTGGKLAFAEWVIPKTTLYVGEAVPAQLRLYVDSQVRWDLQQMPSASGDGFVLQKFPQPRKETVQREGRNYDLLIFKTALIPAKSGKLTVPATDVNFIAVLPQRRQRRNVPRMPGFPDMFNDPFFDNAFSPPQQVKTQTSALELDVKPLPPGKPKDFSGAVGLFTLTTKAAPVRVKAGDPITVTAEVSGIGSFDRMQAPHIAEEPGWRAYPPNSKFKQDDDVGISGVKTFETALIADSAKDHLPKIEFSFFDPVKEKYVTLTDESNLVTVEGTVPPPATAPAPNAMAAATASATPSATPQPKVNDIFYIQTESKGWGATFEPPWQTHSFWLMQLLPLGGLMAFCGWRWRQVRLGDKRARRLAALRQAREETLKALRQQPMNPGDFHNTVVRLLQIETALTPAALKLEREPATVDAEAACASRQLDSDTDAEVRRLFAAHDELRYAGSGGNGETVSPDRRERVLKILESFEKSHA